MFLQVVHEGELLGMRTEKQDIETARKDVEVGFRFGNELVFELEDKVVCYKSHRVPQKLNWNLGF